jgi:hypothetical protein
MTRFRFCNGENLFVQSTEADVARLVRDGYASFKPLSGGRKRVLVLAANVLYVDDCPPPLRASEADLDDARSTPELA